MRQSRYLLAGPLLVLLLASIGFAGGANVYPNGAEGFWMGAAPPPGFYYVNYDLYYNAHEYTGNRGSEIKAGPLAGFKIDVFANVSRFIYISEKQIFGANWGSHVFLIFQDVNIDSAGGNSHVSGFGDMIIDPFILCWHWPNLHITTGLDIYVPTGDYEAGRIANLSANVFVFEPVLGITYMTPKEGLTVSAKFMYDLPQKNNDFTNPFNGAVGDLQYGQEFHFDYSVDYMLNENWKAGIGGYFYKQMTNDVFNGTDVRAGKGRVFAVGPGVEYAKGKFIASFRSQFEMEAENRAEGISNWLRAVWVF